MGRFYKYTIIKPHPLQVNRWMVWIPILPFIPPFYGTKAECEKARKIAEKNAEKYINANNVNTQNYGMGK